jgi:hypothetical protein
MNFLAGFDLGVQCLPRFTTPERRGTKPLRDRIDG